MTQRTDKHSNTAAGIVLRFAAIAITLVLQAVLLFGGAAGLPTIRPGGPLPARSRHLVGREGWRMSDVMENTT